MPPPAMMVLPGQEGYSHRLPALSSLHGSPAQFLQLHHTLFCFDSCVSLSAQ